MIDDPELRLLFKAESEDHLARIDAGLLRLEKTPADPALLEELFRESHSLKGAARMLGLSRIETAAHALESMLNGARKNQIEITPKTIEEINLALDELRAHIQEASSVVPQPPVTTVSATSETSFPAIDETTTLTPPPSSEHSEPPAPAAPSHPLPQAESGMTDFTEPFRIETVRVDTHKLDDLLTQVGELSVIQGRSQHRLALMEELLERWAVLERGRHDRGIGPSTRLGTDGEALAQFGRLLKQTRDTLFTDSAQLESTATLLESQVRSIRLLPLSTLFALFPRMVRDLTREYGKEAELTFQGGDITVDKRILEEMKDPLMHLIRNAIDHGIESPDERERLGKPRSGTVQLCATREDSRLLLEVRDDGRGLDTAQIRQEAGKRGLHDEATLASMTPEQLQQLIFIPGFSTRSFVTELSGRGVGLDVVRINVERMKGAIHLKSRFGEGLTLQLRLPLSLVTTRLLLTRVGGRRYGLPIEFIETSMRVRQRDLFTLDGHPAVALGTRPMIVAYLADLLELPASERENPDILSCIVIQVGDDRLGLLADELLADEEVVPKPLGAPLRRVRNVSALAMLGNGEICPVLNPADLLLTAHRTGGSTMPGVVPREATRPVVLLVEDSALTRAMEQRILGDAGYEVVTAVDGVDALNVLGKRSFAAVVTDIVMPNMDGLSLTERIRADTRHKELPVILVTTLASAEDRRRGLDAGANAYIPKPTFDQRVLLDTLKRLVLT